MQETKWFPVEPLARTPSFWFKQSRPRAHASGVSTGIGPAPVVWCGTWMQATTFGIWITHEFRFHDGDQERKQQELRGRTKVCPQCAFAANATVRTQSGSPGTPRRERVTQGRTRREEQPTRSLGCPGRQPPRSHNPQAIGLLVGQDFIRYMRYRFSTRCTQTLS